MLHAALPQDTLRKDIVVGLPEHGFQLLFEPRSQRLRLVEVVDTTRLQVLVRSPWLALGWPCAAPGLRIAPCGVA